MKKKKILLIEDEPCQVLMVGFRLEANNFDFISACNGEEGLKKAHEEKPDLILLDLFMPGINGYEVCRRLKLDQGTQNIPIVFFTASVGHDIKVKFREYGADDYICKPFEAEDLLSKINVLLKEKD